MREGGGGGREILPTQGLCHGERCGVVRPVLTHRQQPLCVRVCVWACVCVRFVLWLKRTREEEGRCIVCVCVCVYTRVCLFVL